MSQFFRTDKQFQVETNKNSKKDRIVERGEKIKKYKIYSTLALRLKEIEVEQMSREKWREDFMEMIFNSLHY
jgi:hypothetical protein